MLNIEDEIIKFIRKNRVSTTEVADALGKTGGLSELRPIVGDQHKVGRVRCVFAAYESNYEVHDQIRDIKEGEVVVVFVHACQDRAILGDIVSRFVLFYQGAEALVVDGSVRDASRFKREKYSIWAKDFTPIGCFNTPAQRFPSDKRREIEKKYNGGIAVCDDGGVVIIPVSLLDDEILEKLHNIELQEDVWSYCLNTLKWDTKRIICDKEYLKNVDILPDTYKERLTQLSKSFDKNQS